MLFLLQVRNLSLSLLMLTQHQASMLTWATPQLRTASSLPLTQSLLSLMTHLRVKLSLHQVTHLTQLSHFRLTLRQQLTQKLSQQKVTTQRMTIFMCLMLMRHMRMIRQRLIQLRSR